MDGKQVILRLILINGCLKSLATFLSLQLLIVGKNFLIGNLFPMPHDIDIFFAGPYCPGQRGLNEHSNGLLRQNGQPK